MPRRVFACLLLALGVAERAGAQAGNPPEGATEFVAPVGARSMSLGQAVVASARGGEAVWWNPALIARTPRDATLNSVSGMEPVEADLAATALYAIPRVLSVALSLRYFNYGRQESALTQGSGETGSFNPSAVLAAATFAAPFGDRFAVGTTFKLLTISFNCTGTCPNQPQSDPVTGAVDIGVQYIGTKDSLFTIGAAVRNLGLPLQFNDSPQSDPLPGRVDVGFEIAPKFPQYPGLSLRASASIVTRIVNNSGPGFRAGGEVSWLNQYFGRAGYVQNGPTGSGPTLGAGIARGRWRIDFAQFLSETAAATGIRPTYFSLRYAF